MGTDIRTGAVILTIIDDWDWSAPEHHLIALQNKLNAYLEFIEDGQIESEYPQGSGRVRRIEIVAKFAAPEAATQFLRRANEQTAHLVASISMRIFDENDGPAGDDLSG